MELHSTGDQQSTILHLTTDSAIGGTEKMIVQVAASLNKKGFVSHVVALKPGLPLKELCEKEKVRYHTIGMRSKIDVTALFRLYNLIRDIQPDILHTYLFHANILGRIIGKLVKVPVIISGQRNVDLWRKWYHNIADRITAGFCNLIISNSIAGQRFLTEEVRIPAAKVSVVHNGVELQPAEKCDLNVEDNVKPFTMITVASLTEKKGHKYLFDALRTRTDNWSLILVGTGREEERLKHLCEEYGLCDKIRFVGFQSDIAKFLKQAEIFLLPSLWEGLPVALMEAMSSGCACIATDVGGVSELITDKKNGLLIPAGNSNALREAIDYLYNHPDVRLELGKAASETIRIHFSVIRMVDTLADIYSSALKEKQQ